MTQYLADFNYNPNNLTTVRANTPVSYDIRLSRFAKSVDLNAISLDDKKQIVRNLMPNAEIVRYISSDTELFRGCTLEVVEGIYGAGPTENITTDSLNDLKSKGRAVVYRVNKGGKPDINMTFEFASWVNIYVKHFDKLHLDYDQYTPDGSLSCQVVIEMPNIPDSFECRFRRELITTFNNTVQSVKELIQFSKETLPATDLALDDTSTVAKGYFCIGDSHVVRASRAAGAPWSAYADEGMVASSRRVTDAITRLTSGSTVCISLGENDITNTTSNISTIVDSVMNALVTSQISGHETSFLLLPVGDTPIGDRRREFRSAMQGAINSSTSFVNIIDLDQPEFTIARDGRHVTESSYINALRRIE